MSEEKHNGDLGNDGHFVFYDDYWSVPGVCVRGTYWGPTGTAFLQPQEALSLLAWLRQEEQRIESMTKEQAE